jgi:hypothetical protein
VSNITADDIVHASFLLDTPQAMDYAYEAYCQKAGPTPRWNFEQGVRVMAMVDVNTLKETR